MGPITLVATFFVMWWMAFFAVINIGGHSQAQAGSVIEGTDPAAPVRPNLRQKVIWATIGGVVLTIIVWLAVSFDVLGIANTSGY